MTFYLVKPGDYLLAIAKANNTTVPEILRLNPTIKDNIIYPKQKLTLPDKNAGLDEISFKNKSDDKNTYTIKKGDTFEKIEKNHWLKKGQISKANPLINPKKLVAGKTVVKIPEKEFYLIPVDKKDQKFNRLLAKILKDEGGFKPDDKDKVDTKTNNGIKQETYDNYLKLKAYDKKQKNYVIKDVKNITDEEVKEIYYNLYYLKSGADKESNEKTAYWMFDTAVSRGVDKAKQLRETCNTDNQKWYIARKNDYENDIKKNQLRKKFLPGWLNRINRIKDVEIK